MGRAARTRSGENERRAAWTRAGQRDMGRKLRKTWNRTPERRGKTETREHRGKNRDTGTPRNRTHGMLNKIPRACDRVVAGNWAGPKN